jgi:hypothetical protein
MLKERINELSDEINDQEDPLNEIYQEEARHFNKPDNRLFNFVTNTIYALAVIGTTIYSINQIKKDNNIYDKILNSAQETILPNQFFGNDNDNIDTRIKEELTNANIKPNNRNLTRYLNEFSNLNKGNIQRYYKEGTWYTLVDPNAKIIFPDLNNDKKFGDINYQTK